MDSRSNATRLRQMGILDMLAALFLIGMGVMFWTTELNAKVGGDGAIILLAQTLIVTGALLVPLGALSIAHASWRTAATAAAAIVCACVVAAGSAAYALFVWASHGAFLAWALVGVVLGLPTLILVRKVR